MTLSRRVKSVIFDSYTAMYDVFVSADGCRKSAFYRSRLDIGCAAMNPEQLQVVSGIISGRDVSQLIVGRAWYSTYWRPTMNFVLLSIAPFKPDRYETSGDQRCYLELLPDCKTLSTNLPSSFAYFGPQRKHCIPQAKEIDLT